MDVSSIKVSIMSLAKNNNGFFKSEKQAAFLTNILSKLDGCIGHNVIYNNSVPVFVDWDEKGIIKIVAKSSKTGDKLMFVRNVEGQLNVLQQKELKKLKRLLKQAEKSYVERVNAWENGTYGIGDYKNDSNTVRLYNHFNDQILTRIDSLKDKIASY